MNKIEVTQIPEGKRNGATLQNLTEDDRLSVIAVVAICRRQEAEIKRLTEACNRWSEAEILGTPCSVSYLEGALAKAKTWSIHNSPYASHLPDHKDWLRGYADYSKKFSSPNDQTQ